MMLSEQYQLAMKGFNTEFAAHCGKTKWVDFYAAAGPYYFSGGDKGCKFWGGKARLIARIKENWTIELSNSYDKIFHDRFQCQLTFSVPLGSGPNDSDDDKCCSMSDTLFSRMVQPIDRQEIIVQEHCTIRVPALDPSTCQPYNFIFVNNKSHSLGTYESPYPTLAQAQANSVAGDIIYVYPGDGTTQGMDKGIVLKMDQKFWGSGIEHSLSTTQGTFIIPAQSTTAPQMTNSVGSGITLAATNQVSGFTITNAFDHAILGTNLTNVDISNCTVNGAMLDQISLGYSSSYGVANLRNLTVLNSLSDGIAITSTAPSVECIIKDCMFQDNNVYTISTSCSNQAKLSLVNNIFDRNTNGTNLSFSGTASLLISDNTFTNTSSVSSCPLLISAQTNPLYATITNNTIKDNVTGAMHILLNNTSTAQLVISDNTISNNTSGVVGPFGAAIFIDPASSSTGNCYLNLLNNYISGNDKSAFYCNQGSFNELAINAIGNTITDNNSSGLAIAVGCNRLTFTATDNSVLHGADNAISTTTELISVADITISNNQITGNVNGSGANGIAVTHRGADLNLSITNNNISDNDGSGVLLYSSIPITNVDINISNNTVSNNDNLGSNAAAGIDIHEYVNLSATLTKNGLSNNGNPVVPAVCFDTTDASPSVCLTMRGNNSDTGYSLINGSGTFNLAPCNVDTVNTGTITTTGTINNVQSCPDGTLCPP